MDIIYINGLEVETIIGIYAWEREVKQLVRISIEMATDINQAAKTDNINDTLNYNAVAKRLIEFVGDSQFELVESLAGSCADLVLAEFPVPWVRLKLSKPGAVRGSEDVGVIIERRRDDQ